MNLKEFSIKCNECNNDYDNTKYIPKVINCGHTYCEICIKNNILKNSIKSFICPEDGKKIIINNEEDINNFPTNYLILNMINHQNKYKNSFDNIDENKSGNFSNISDQKTMNLNFKRKNSYNSDSLNHCNIHFQKLDIICLEKNCQEKICSNCALFGNHKNHKIIQNDEFLYKIKEKIDDIMKLYESIKLKENNINSNEFLFEYKNIILNKKNILEKEITNYYNEFIDKLKENKKNLLTNFNFIFNIQEEKLKNEILIPSKIVNKLNKWKIQTFNLIQNFIKNENDIENSFDIMNIIEEKNTIFKGVEFEDYLKDFKNNIELNINNRIKNVNLIKNNYFENIVELEICENDNLYNESFKNKINHVKFKKSNINTSNHNIENNISNINGLNNNKLSENNLLKLNTKDIDLLNLNTNTNINTRKTNWKKIKEHDNTGKKIAKKTSPELSCNNYSNYKKSKSKAKLFQNFNNVNLNKLSIDLKTFSIKNDLNNINIDDKYPRKRNKSFLNNKSRNKSNNMNKLIFNNIKNDTISNISNKEFENSDKQFIIKEKLKEFTINKLGKWNISNYNIKDIDIKLIYEFINKNKNIIHLDLSNNNITDKGFKVLIKAICNSNIQKLNLNNNNISINGLKEIKNYLFINNKQLTFIELKYNKITDNNAYYTIYNDYKNKNIVINI